MNRESLSYTQRPRGTQLALPIALCYRYLSKKRNNLSNVFHESNDFHNPEKRMQKVNDAACSGAKCFQLVRRDFPAASVRKFLCRYLPLTSHEVFRGLKRHLRLNAIFKRIHHETLQENH